MLVQVEEDLLLQVEGQRGGDLLHVEAARDVEHEVVVLAQLLRQVVGQPVEARELVDLVELNLVPGTGCVAFVDHLSDVGEDGRGQRGGRRRGGG